MHILAKIKLSANTIVAKESGNCTLVYPMNNLSVLKIKKQEVIRKKARATFIEKTRMELELSKQDSKNDVPKSLKKMKVLSSLCLLP